jgi:hypothetical protein
MIVHVISRIRPCLLFLILTLAAPITAAGAAIGRDEGRAERVRGDVSGGRSSIRRAAGCAARRMGFVTRMHEGLLGGPVRVGRDPGDTSVDLSSLLSGFALPLNDLSKIGHDPPR